MAEGLYRKFWCLYLGTLIAVAVACNGPGRSCWICRCALGKILAIGAVFQFFLSAASFSVLDLLPKGVLHP